MPDLLSEPELGFVRERLHDLGEGIVTAATAGDVGACLQLARALTGYVSWLLSTARTRETLRAVEARDDASAGS